MGMAGEIAVLTEFASQYGDELPNRHELDIAKTFQLSWDPAPELGQQILRAMAELAPVPRPLLRDILNLPPQVGLRDPFGQSISELSRLSPMELDMEQNPVAHRLILAFVWHRNTTDNASPFDQCREVIQGQMLQAVETTDIATFRALEAIVPHAE